MTCLPWVSGNGEPMVRSEDLGVGQLWGRIWHLLCDVVLGWRRQWHPTPGLLPGKSHGQRSLVGCSPWGRTESDTTEWLHFHFSLSCIGEGNGNPLQCSSLENPRDGGGWWATVYGVAQSRTRLKRLSSSSSSRSSIGLQSFSGLALSVLTSKLGIIIVSTCRSGCEDLMGKVLATCEVFGKHCQVISPTLF